jgi:hypothetical protein
MSLLQQPLPYIQDGKAWYFLAIYYARNNWAELASCIIQFYSERQEQFCDYFITFSENRGEHIQLTLISPNCNTNYQTEIEDYFQQYLNIIPSICTKKFPYGKVLWCNYPNNSMIWNTFKFTNYTELHIRFHEKTQQLALQLLDGDFSQDNIFTLALYLTTKGLMYFDPNMQNNIVADTLSKIMSDFQDYRSVGAALQSIIEQMDLQQMCETIQSYVEENPSEYSTELIEWLTEVEKMKGKEFQYFYGMTCGVIGLRGMFPILVLALLDLWQKTLPLTNN